MELAVERSLAHGLAKVRSALVGVPSPTQTSLGNPYVDGDRRTMLRAEQRIRHWFSVWDAARSREQASLASGSTTTSSSPPSQHAPADFDE